MGTSTAFDERTGRWVLDCWQCSNTICHTRDGGWVLVPDGNYNPNVPVREMVGARPWTPDTGIEVPA